MQHELNGKSHTLNHRVDRLERLAFGYVDTEGATHPGFVSRLVRLENIAKLIAVLGAIPAAHYLGIPTEKLGDAAQALLTGLLHL